MEIIIQDAAQLPRLAADAICELVARKPDAVLGLATGSSPVALYQELGARVGAGELSLAGCSAFALDEYVGLAPGHPESYREVLLRDFVSQVDIDPGRVFAPPGDAADIPAACAAYEAAMQAAGGVDLQILGIGTDGHIAFNEPGSSLASRTRIKTLTSRTRTDNARFFGGDPTLVPLHCLTQGVGTILQARHLLLLATGAGKAEAVAAMVEGPVTAQCPASALQLHPHVSVLVDGGAAGLLAQAEYYREVFAGKPSWQGI